jgi:hypothetical protein
MTFEIIPIMIFDPRFVLKAIIKIKTLHLGEWVYPWNVELWYLTGDSAQSPWSKLFQIKYDIIRNL